MPKLNAKGMVVRTHSSSVDEKEALSLLGLNKKDALMANKARTVLKKAKVLRKSQKN